MNAHRRKKTARIERSKELSLVEKVIEITKEDLKKLAVAETFEEKQEVVKEVLPVQEQVLEQVEEVVQPVEETKVEFSEAAEETTVKNKPGRKKKVEV